MALGALGGGVAGQQLTVFPTSLCPLPRLTVGPPELDDGRLVVSPAEIVTNSLVCLWVFGHRIQDHEVRPGWHCSHRAGRSQPLAACSGMQRLLHEDCRDGVAAHALLRGRERDNVRRRRFAPRSLKAPKQACEEDRLRVLRGEMKGSPLGMSLESA